MRRRVTSHQPPMMTRDCGDGSFTVRSCGGWRVVFFSLYVDTVMNAKFGEVAYTLHSNCDVWSPKLKKSLMFGLCHLFIVVSMSKLRNPIGEEAGIWPARKIMVMVEGLKMFRRNMQEERSGMGHGSIVYIIIYIYFLTWSPGSPIWCLT